VSGTTCSMRAKCAGNAPESRRPIFADGRVAATRSRYGRVDLASYDGTELRLGQSNRVVDFADWLGCSPKTLRTSCMTTRGLGPKVLIEQRLVLEAQRRLVNSALPVEQIGAELGFCEPANFARLFKRIAGTTPGRFRTTHLGS